MLPSERTVEQVFRNICGLIISNNKRNNDCEYASHQSNNYGIPARFSYGTYRHTIYVRFFYKEYIFLRLDGYNQKPATHVDVLPAELKMKVQVFSKRNGFGFFSGTPKVSPCCPELTLLDIGYLCRHFLLHSRKVHRLNVPEHRENIQFCLAETDVV